VEGVNRDYDLIVIGGGPGGASAAITAARAGAHVLLLERGRFPRHKVCGEFISNESLSLVKWLLGDAHQELLQKSLSLTDSQLFLDGRKVRVPISPAAASIARYDLDEALWSAARNAGVTVLQETTAQPPQGEGPFLVATSAGEFRARAVVNASGRWSNLKMAGQNSNNGHSSNRSSKARWLGMKAHFHCDGTPTADPFVDLYFIDGGYCGVQPVRAPDGTILLNACALVRPDSGETLAEVLRRHPTLADRSRSWRPAFLPVSTFPVIHRDPVPVNGTICNVGDAAGFVDPFVGDGISLALRGGNLAARNLLPFLSNHGTLKQSLEAYSKDYRQTLRPVYRNSSLLRRFLGFPRGVRRAALSVCENSPRLARYLVESTRSKTVEFEQMGA
jgi:flavin-dependent dehydrogenase